MPDAVAEVTGAEEVQALWPGPMNRAWVAHGTGTAVRRRGRDAGIHHRK